MTNQVSQQNQAKFKKQCHAQREKYLNMLGVDLGPIHILIKCRTLWGMIKQNERIVHKWSDEVEIFPIQCCIFGKSKGMRGASAFHSQYKSLIIDDRFVPRRLTENVSIEIGQAAMYIGGQEKYHGLYG